MSKLPPSASDKHAVRIRRLETGFASFLELWLAAYRDQVVQAEELGQNGPPLTMRLLAEHASNLLTELRFVVAQRDR